MNVNIFLNEWADKMHYQQNVGRGLAPAEVGICQISAGASPRPTINSICPLYLNELHYFVFCVIIIILKKEGKVLRMKKYVPLCKQSKKKQKEHHAALRESWGNTNPMTKKMPNGKIYNRKKSKHSSYNEPCLDFLFLN